MQRDLELFLGAQIDDVGDVSGEEAPGFLHQGMLFGKFGGAACQDGAGFLRSVGGVWGAWEQFEGEAFGAVGAQGGLDDPVGFGVDEDGQHCF